jgi:uncharacterized protein (DUF488 family)
MATPEFAQGLEHLLTTSSQARTAIMCAEAVPWRCHRSLVADALVVSRRRVFHIVGAGKPRAHRRTAFLRVRKGLLRYP